MKSSVKRGTSGARGITLAIKQEIPDEIPTKQGVESEQLRVLAHIYLNGFCRGG